MQPAARMKLFDPRKHAAVTNALPEYHTSLAQTPGPPPGFGCRPGPLALSVSETPAAPTTLFASAPWTTQE